MIEALVDAREKIELRQKYLIIPMTLTASSSAPPKARDPRIDPASPYPDKDIQLGKNAAKKEKQKKRKAEAAAAAVAAAAGKATGGGKGAWGSGGQDGAGAQGADKGK